MVFMKQANKFGDYIDKNGVRFEILSCNRTESLEWVETGEFETFTDEEGNEIKTPVMKQQVVINKGWDAFDSIEKAAEDYGLTLQPLTNEEKIALEQEDLSKEEEELI